MTVHRFLPALLVALLGLVFSPPAHTAPQDAMAYCTAADVEATYDTDTLAQRTGDADGIAVDEGRLQIAIDAYAATMAPYVRARYAEHDFSTTEPTLKTINVEGAYLELAKRRPGGLDEGEREDLAALQRQLRDIASGVTALAVDPLKPTPLDDEEIESMFKSNTRLFGRRC